MTGPGATFAIFLAGFMGSGKSTVGREVAKRLGWTFADLDSEIERTAGERIPVIFDRHGEAGFRKREHEALREQANRALTGTRLVLALGGGTYAFARNRDLVRKVGPTIWLDAGTATLWERVRLSSNRPLAHDRSRFERLHRDRRESYAMAEFRIDASPGPTQVANEVLSLGWIGDLQHDA